MNRLTLMHTQDAVPERSSARRSYSSTCSPSALTGLVIIDTDAPTSAANTASHDAPQTDTHLHECTMQLTINADCINELRQLMMRTCGRLLVFIRTQPVAHAQKMKVWLCLNAPASDLVMDAVMRALPSAEFGRVTYA